MTRDIRINPKLGSTSSNDFPTIDFGGLSSSSISLKVEDDGSVVYTGTYGTLFSITDNKDGLLHSVNDISGLPILQVHSNDYVQLGKWDKYTLVANSDKVGIGLTAPSTKFHIYATQSGAFRLQDGTQNSGYLLTSDSNGVGSWTSSSNLNLITGSGSTNYVPKWTSTTGLSSTSSIYIDGNGNVGIDTSTPDSKLLIKGSDSTSSNYSLKVDNSLNNPLLYVRNDGNVGIGTNTLTHKLNVFGGNLNHGIVSVVDGTDDTYVGLGVFNGSSWVTRINKGGGIEQNSTQNNYFNTSGVTTIGGLPNTNSKFNVIGNGNHGIVSIVDGSDDIYTGIGVLNGSSWKFRVNKNGDTGIGINVVTARLHVVGVDSLSTNYGLKVQNSGGTDNFVVRNDGNVGINTSAPTTKLHIYATQSGAFRLQDGTQNTGYVLTSDSNGVATWTQSSNVFNGGTGSFGVVFSKGDGTITTSDTAKLVIPFGGYITGWRILEISSTPVSSSIVVDVKKTTYDNYPSSFSSIAGSEKPTLSSVVKNQDTTLTTWTTSFEAGDIFEFDVESVTSAKNVSVMLMYIRTINL